MFANARGDPRDLPLVIIGGLDDGMSEHFSKGDEIALRVDHHLLHQLGATLQQAAQQMRLSRHRIALHEQTRGQQFLFIDEHRHYSTIHTHFDSDSHGPTLDDQASNRHAVIRNTCGYAVTSTPNLLLDFVLGLISKVHSWHKT